MDDRRSHQWWNGLDSIILGEESSFGEEAVSFLGIGVQRLSALTDLSGAEKNDRKEVPVG